MMGTDTFEYAKIASPEEIADYLTSLAIGLRRGDVRLEPGDETLEVGPATSLTFEVRAKAKDARGKLKLGLWWRRDSRTRAGDLRVSASAAEEGRGQRVSGPRTRPGVEARAGAR